VDSVVTGSRSAIALVLSGESVPGRQAPLLRVAGQPLVGHAVRAAAEAPSVRRIAVWTDREDEAAEVKDAEVVRFPWNWAGIGFPPVALVWRVIEQVGPVTEDLLVVLPSRTPLRPIGSIQAALDGFRPDVGGSLTVLFEQKGNLGRIRNGLFRLFRKDLKQRQDLEPIYADAGSVYVTTPAAVRKQEHLLGSMTQGIVLDGAVGYEVTDELDARIAERWLQTVCRP
jgi:CMP-N-acetylneuraminic acid synthetase